MVKRLEIKTKAKACWTCAFAWRQFRLFSLSEQLGFLIREASSHLHFRKIAHLARRVSSEKKMAVQEQLSPDSLAVKAVQRLTFKTERRQLYEERPFGCLLFKVVSGMTSASCPGLLESYYGFCR